MKAEGTLKKALDMINEIRNIRHQKVKVQHLILKFIKLNT